MNDCDLSELYKIRFSNDRIPQKNAIWQVICHDYLQQFITPSDTVVDIASGFGEFINNIKSLKKIAVDLNPDAKNFLKSEIEFHHCTATNLSSIIANNSADVVFTSNFLEHLPDKNTLDVFLTQVFAALKPRGKYIILGPNLRYLPGKYWDFYDHHLGLTHLSLCEALMMNNFRIDVCIDRFLPYTTQSALPMHPLLVKTYLKLPIFWKFLGKQFLIVAHKVHKPDINCQ
jgi:SAM-dependent methyltransferase